MKTPIVAAFLLLPLTAIAGPYEDAMTAYSEGRTADSIAAFESYASANPDSATTPFVLYGIGAIHEHEGNPEAAIDAYTRVVASSPWSSAGRDAARKLVLIHGARAEWPAVIEASLNRMLILEQYHPAYLTIREALGIIDTIEDAGRQMEPDSPASKWLDVRLDPELFPRSAEAFAFARGPDPETTEGNLLRNSGFERDGRPVAEKSPVGWEFIPAHGPYGKDHDGVVGAVFLKDLGAPRTGEFCVGKTTAWGTPRGWYRQTIRAVPDERYDCSVYGWTGPSGVEQGKVRLGVDPLGGTDPGADSVAWTEYASTDGSWRRFALEGDSAVRADGSFLTIFLELRQDVSADRNAILFDDAAVVVSGAAEPPPAAFHEERPLPTPTPLPPVPGVDHTRMGYDPALLPGGLLVFFEPPRAKMEKKPELFEKWRTETLPHICREFRGCGMVSARAGLCWYDIEYEKGVYDWRVADEIVFQLEQHGIVQVACVATSPPWALDPGAVAALRRQGVGEGLIGCTQISPEHWDDYERYLERLVLRYRDCIDHWEIWNEPDGMAGHVLIRSVTGEVTSVEYGGDPEWGTELLKRSARVIRALDPFAIICLGGFEDISPPKARFIEGIYDRDGGKYFDAVGIHTYGTPIHREWFCYLRDVVVVRGDAAKPFWVTEYGLRGQRDVVQAYRLRRSIRALRELPYVVIANGHVANALWDGGEGPGYRANREMAGETGPRTVYHQDFEEGAAALLNHWEWDTRSEPKKASWLKSGIEGDYPEQGDYYLTGHSNGTLIRHDLDTYARPASPDPVFSFLVLADTEADALAATLEVTVEPSDVCKEPKTIVLHPEGLPIGRWERVEIRLRKQFPEFADDVVMAVFIAGRVEKPPEEWEFAVDDIRIE